MQVVANVLKEALICGPFNSVDECRALLSSVQFPGRAPGEDRATALLTFPWVQPGALFLERAVKDSVTSHVPDTVWPDSVLRDTGRKVKAQQFVRCACEAALSDIKLDTKVVSSRLKKLSQYASPALVILAFRDPLPKIH